MNRRPRPKIKLNPVEIDASVAVPPGNLDKKATITIDENTFEVEADDLEKISGKHLVLNVLYHIFLSAILPTKVATWFLMVSRCAEITWFQKPKFI